MLTTILAVNLWALVNARQFMATSTSVLTTSVSLQDAPYEEFDSTLDTYLNKLEKCESGGRDVTVLDTNNLNSYAYLQFQQGTFDGFGKLYGLPHDDIHSRDEQRAIAAKMIQNNLWYHWKNCGLKIGLDKYKPVTTE